VLPLVVQIVPAAGGDVNRCSVLLRARTKSFVVFRRVFYSPAAQMHFMQKKLEFLVWMLLE